MANASNTLAGKVALITGSGRGMGRAHAVLLPANGPDIVVHDIVAYCAAKAALLGFTKAWAKELAPDRIRVNALAPGGVTSPMAIEKDGIEAVRQRMAKVPLGRWAEPEEIAHAVLYLAAPSGSFITG